MILEIAQIEVKAGMEQAFEEGAAKAVPLFRNARGCHGMELQRSIETAEGLGDRSELGALLLAREADPPAHPERSDQRVEQRPRNAGNGAHRGAPQRHRAVLHQYRG